MASNAYRKNYKRKLISAGRSLSNHGKRNYNAPEKQISPSVEFMIQPESSHHEHGFDVDKFPISSVNTHAEFPDHSVPTCDNSECS